MNIYNRTARSTVKFAITGLVHLFEVEGRACEFNRVGCRGSGVVGVVGTDGVFGVFLAGTFAVNHFFFVSHVAVDVAVGIACVYVDTADVYITARLGRLRAVFGLEHDVAVLAGLDVGEGEVFFDHAVAEGAFKLDNHGV